MKNNSTKFSHFHKTFCFYITEKVTRRCSLKKVLFENSPNLLKKTCTRVSFLIKMCRLEAGGLDFFKKETPGQAFSREFCVMFKKVYFVEQQQTAASDITHERELT